MSEGLQQLPIEIVEVIIDYLHNDKKSLRTCCLVSREWLPTSRLHLIPSITVHYKNYRQLLQHLELPKSRLSFGVSELRLVARPDEDAFYDRAQNAWMNDALPSLVKHFSSIRSIVLRDIIWRVLTLRSCNALLNAFPKVEKVELFCCHFQELRRHAELLHSFEAAKFIKTVGCDYDFNRKDQHPYSDLTISPSVRKLVIDGQRPVFIAWAGAQNLRHLEHFSLQFISLPFPSGAQMLVSRAGSTLRRLQAGFSVTYVHSITNQETLDLSHNSSLEELELELSLSGDMLYVPEVTNLSFVVTLLSSISSPMLRQIRIRILLGTPDELSGVDWPAIDHLSTQRAWGISLKHIFIELISRASYIVLEDFMEKAELKIYPGLSRIAKRGLLDVRFVPFRMTS